jgi:hypothetical protein
VNSAVLGSEPLEIADTEQTHEIAEDAEIRVRHQLPHESGKGRRRHQRQQQQNGRDIVKSRRFLEQQRDTETEDQLEGHREPSIGKRDEYRVPERRVADQRRIVIEPDEALQHRQVQTEAHHSSRRRCRTG